MAFNPVTDAYKYKFQENMQFALQEYTDRFSSMFTYQPELKGEAVQKIQLIADGEASIDAPEGPTPESDFDVEPVWMTPRRISDGFLIKKEHEIKSAVSLQSTYVQSLARKIVRARNTILASAFFANRLTGKQPTTQEPYTSSASVNLVSKDYVRSGAATNSGLTFEKLIRAQGLLIKNEVDLETDEMCMAVGAEEEEDLWNDVKYLSKDYREKLVVDEGAKKVVSFLGISFVRFQRLPTVSGTPSTRRCPLWVKSGMHYGDFKPLDTQLGQDPAAQFRVRGFGEQWLGATRSEDKKVIEVQTHRP